MQMKKTPPCAIETLMCRNTQGKQRTYSGGAVAGFQSRRRCWRTSKAAAGYLRRIRKRIGKESVLPFLSFSWDAPAAPTLGPQVRRVHPENAARSAFVHSATMRHAHTQRVNGDTADESNHANGAARTLPRLAMP